jgi:protein gp37
MNEDTNIAWTDQTWNPVHGCSRVSSGCDSCYAERISRQYGHTDHPWTPEHASENVTTREDKLDEPYQLDEASRIFVNSMSDLFHAEVSDAFIQDVFSVMRNCPHHVFQILTKRPGRAAHMPLEWPPNVWIGTSVEDDRVRDRLDLLRPCDAETLFVSFEPLIGPVGDVDLSGFDWVIVGGESGPDYREMAHEWVWPIRDAARRDGAAFFFKQSAAVRNETNPYLREEDGVRRPYRELPDLHPAVVEARTNWQQEADA